jgi:RimJ/RimL family protein N-acetyltransferase
VLEIETNRLRLRAWRDADVGVHARMRTDPEMQRYMGDGHLWTAAESREWAASVADHWDEHDFGLWAVELLATGKYIGWLGLVYPKWIPELMPTVEIGWFLDRGCWGQGLATEGATAALGVAFDDLGVDEVIGIHNPANAASRRVMEKVGLSYWKSVQHPRYGFPIDVRRVRRTDARRPVGRPASTSPP